LGPLQTLPLAANHATASVAGIDYAIAKGVTLNAAYTSLDEANALLGAQGGGILDFTGGSQTAAATFGMTSTAQRAPARVNLARFYLARDLIPEAKGVLDVAASDEQAAAEGTPLLLRAIANVMMGRGADAMKDLTQPSVASRSEAVLWRALAFAQLGKWAEAREGFRSLDAATATLPLELQRYAFTEAVRAAVEVHDYGAAQTLLNEFDTLGPAPQRDADLTLLKGRLMEGLGRLSEALTFYRTVAESNERPAAARARLREIVQALRESSRRAEQRLGISGAQLFVLEKLADAPSQSLNDLAARTFTHQSSVSTVVARLVEQLPPERVLFGSNFPLFYFEAAMLKVQESGLPEDKKTMLFEGNARRILPRTTG
jgi:tetratricopeptide (TPR) repeat protein